MIATTAPSRLVITNAPERLCLILPAPRNWGTLICLAGWLVIWGIGFVATLGAIFGPQINSPAALFFAVAWLLGWCGAGLFSLYVVLWMLIGREVVTLDQGTLTIRRDIRGRGKDQCYRVAMIAALHAEDDRAGLYELATTLRLFGLGGGKVRFDYSGLDFRFGSGLRRDEADEVVALLRHHPLFASRTAVTPA